MSREVKSVFSLVPVVSFKSASKISSYLVRAKLYPLERFVGLRQCKNRRSEVCTNVAKTDTFFSTVTGKTIKSRI